MQQQLIAGDTLNFLTTLPDYPASAAWVLKFRLVPRTVGVAPITLTATAEGDAHRITKSTVDTAAWGADNYSWTSWVEKGAETYSIDRGQISIRQDPRTAVAGYDGRSASEQALAAIETEISARATGGMTIEYTIGNRSLKKEPVTALLVLRSQFRLIVSRERRGQQIANGLGDPDRLGVRFT